MQSTRDELQRAYKNEKQVTLDLDTRRISGLDVTKRTELSDFIEFILENLEAKVVVRCNRNGDVTALLSEDGGQSGPYNIESIEVN